jgi:hypothetical protein
VKRQVRIALIVFIAALAVGWLGLRRSNDVLEDTLASAKGTTP